jgi:hypothetical protein
MENIILDLKERLTSQINFKDFGFILFSYSEFDFGYEYHRSTKYKIDTLKYGFYIDKYEDYSFLSSISYKITFPIINEILLKIFEDKVHLQNFSLNDETIFAIPEIGMQEYTDYHYKQQKLLFIENRIIDEQIFEEALTLFKEQLSMNVLPFFDKIQTLQQINDEILEKYDWMEWSNYISGQTIFKALIIMKLCKNESKYIEFSRSYKEKIYKAISEGHSEYQNLYETLIILLEYLESGKYLELE